MPEQFPLWVVVTHFLNIFFLLLMARSGLEVLSAFPKLYFRSDCRPGHEWLRFSANGVGADARRPSSTQDEEVSWSPLLALPGRKNLGLGRHWHFLGAPFWTLTGVVYLGLVFATGYWRYLVPTSWSIVPESIRAVGTYLHFRLPGPIPGQPYEPTQKLVYFLLIFVLAPFQIATGAAMSPSILARFPWYGRLFGGKQGARSLHFLGLFAFGAFTLLHTALVVVQGLPEELAAIVLGDEGANRALAVVVGVGGLVSLLLFHVGITLFSLRLQAADAAPAGRRRRAARAAGRSASPLTPGVPAPGGVGLLPRQRLSAAEPGLRAGGGRELRPLPAGRRWPGRDPALADPDRTAGARLPAPDHPAQLHPRLDRDRRMGRRATAPRARSRAADR